MSKHSSLNLRIIPSLNRSIVYTAFPCGKPIQFAIMHNKYTSGLQFQLDTNHFKKYDIHLDMFRNLDRSKFCDTFFNLKNESNEYCDYVSKFNGFKPSFEKYIMCFLDEIVNFTPSKHHENYTQNYLSVTGWKIHSLNNELNFFFIQRKSYNKVTGTKIIRTAGLQFGSQRGLDQLDKYHINMKQSIRKASKKDLEETLNDLF